MPTIITPSRIEECLEVTHNFEFVSEPGSGWSFPCNPDTGELLPLQPAGQESYARALQLVQAGTVLDMGLVRHEWTYRHPTVIACDRCQKPVQLDDAFLSTCSNCGADYSGSGQLLAPRSQWGEETGECLSDILNGGGLDD